ncbi:MAG: UDP-N-acetylglucosamine--N-acetylmuramyl-(pentapeptide) pyrophosphoryl-undecaprenol N-acetylglucosamine transferase [Pikeienuella sp.]
MSLRLAIAAGGTGGHLFPAQALAETALARGWDVRLLSDARGLGYAQGFPEAVARHQIASASPARGGLTGLIGLPVTIARGVVAAARLFRAHRVGVLAAFGGYPTFPPLIAARLLGVPAILHEQNAVLGSVNRRFARSVRAVACGIWPVLNAPAGARLERIGNPVRAAVLAAAERPYVPAGAGQIRLLVFGGSQGASVFARLAPAAVAALPEGLRRRLEVTQQIRPGEQETVASAYAAVGITAELAPFFADLPDRIAASHLVLARAGASTVAEIAAIGRPSILVPLPSAAADHQTANARSLADPRPAILAPEARLDAPTLAADLAAILTDPDRAARMATAARAAGTPDAADRLADLVAAAAR